MIYELSATIAYENKSGSDIKVLSVGHPFPDDTLEVFSLKADSAISFTEYNVFTLTGVPVGASFCDQMDHALIIFGGKDTVVHRFDFGDIENTDDDVFMPSDHNICHISSYDVTYTDSRISVQTYTFTETDRYNHQ